MDTSETIPIPFKWNICSFHSSGISVSFFPQVFILSFFKATFFFFPTTIVCLPLDFSPSLSVTVVQHIHFFECSASLCVCVCLHRLSVTEAGRVQQDDTVCVCVYS